MYQQIACNHQLSTTKRSAENKILAYVHYTWFQSKRCQLFSISIKDDILISSSVTTDEQHMLDYFYCIAYKYSCHLKK